MPSRSDADDAWAQLKSALRAVPGLRWVVRRLRDAANPERRHVRRLLRHRPDQIFQTGGGTKPDRYPDLFTALRDSLDHIPSPRILSFGCSTGEEIVSLKGYVPRARLSGIDINPARIRRARRRIVDPNVQLWAAANIEESRAGMFDAITCLSVLHRRQTLDSWPADPTPYMTFEMFERAVLDLDRHLAVDGVLLLYHTSFRFIETAVAARYVPLICAEPLTLEPFKRYDRNNQPVLEPRAERFALWRKDH